MLIKKTSLLAAVAVSLGLAANYPQMLWWTSFLSLGIFIIFIEREEGSYGKTFLRGALFGTLYMLTVLSYFWFAYPLDWAGVNSRVFSFLVLFLIWFITSLPLGLGIGLWSVSFRYLHRKSHTLYSLFLGAFLWVLFEYLRAIGFSLLYAAEGTLIGPHWTFGFLGYTVSLSSVLLPLAGFGGVWALSFVVFVISYGVSRMMKQAMETKFSRRSVVGASLFALFVLVSYLDIPYRSRQHIEEMDVALVSLYEHPEVLGLTWSEARFEYLYSLLDAAELESVDVLALTEYASFLSSDPLEPIARSNEILEGLVGSDTIVLDSAIKYVDDTTKQAVLSAYSQDDGYRGEYRKRMLTPTGEYLPTVVAFGAQLLGQGEWVTFFNNTRGYRSAHKAPLFITDKGYASVLFCIEAFSPEFYKSAALNGANVLINIASHSNFPGSSTLINQNISVARVRAAESGRYYLQSTSYGPALVVSGRGEVVARSAEAASAVLVESVPMLSGKTPYVLYGRYLPHALFIGIILLVFERLFVNKLRFKELVRKK